MKRILTAMFVFFFVFLLNFSSVLALTGDTIGVEGAETGTGGRGVGGLGVSSQRQEMRSQFLEKLKVVRDERKKTRVENLENRMNEINQNRTEQMLKHLEKMGEILGKIEDRGSKGVGGVTGELSAAIAAARSAIASARAAVETQANKTYTPNVTDEATLRGVVGASISQLQADLKAVRLQVIAAKKAVANAYLALAMARGNASVTPVATESGKKQ